MTDNIDKLANYLNREAARFTSEIDALRAENERLREALNFYAQQDNYEAGYISGERMRFDVEIDDGKRARAALQDITPSSGNVFADIGFTAEDFAAKCAENERLREALSGLLEISQHAIVSGDWKVDGACDPLGAMKIARAALQSKGD